MHRKINRMRLYLRKQCREEMLGLPDCVTISIENRELILSPYEAGDEKLEDVTVQLFDSRDRLFIPRTFLNRTGIKDYVDVVLMADGSTHVSALDENRVGLQKRNAQIDWGEG